MLRTYVRLHGVPRHRTLRGSSLRPDSLLTAPKALELLAGGRVEPLTHPAAGAALLALDVAGLLEAGEERARRELAHLLPGGSAHCVIRRDHADELRRTVLRGEPFEQIVGVRREPHPERPDLALLPHAVEDDDAAHPAGGDEARECIDELLATAGEVARVEQVVAVEEVEGRLSNRVDESSYNLSLARLRQRRSGRASQVTSCQLRASTFAGVAPRTGGPPRRPRR